MEENKTCTEMLNDLAMREDVVAMDPETQRMLWEARDAHANELRVLENELKAVRNEVVNQRNRSSRLEREAKQANERCERYVEQYRAFTAIRDEVEERWSPVTSEWPRYEDLSPVLVGDVVDDGGRRMTVLDVVVASYGASVTLRDDDGNRDYRYCFDGKTFRRWVDSEPTESEDSWERLQEDALKGSCSYWGGDGSKSCEGCLLQGDRGCMNEMKLDLLARAKKLAGVE